MADIAINADQIGAYEVALAANTAQAFLPAGNGVGELEVTHHSGASPLYVLVGAGNAAVKGATAILVNPGERTTIPMRAGAKRISVISASAAVVSVNR